MEWTLIHQGTLFLAGFIIIYVIAKIYFRW